MSTIKITDTTTGESRLYYGENWDYASQFDWEDNNNSCDCNRGLKFQYAHGATWDTAEGVECGNGRYRVDSVFHDGVIVWSELPPPKPSTTGSSQ